MQEETYRRFNNNCPCPEFHFPIRIYGPLCWRLFKIVFGSHSCAAAVGSAYSSPSCVSAEIHNIPFPLAANILYFLELLRGIPRIRDCPVRLYQCRAYALHVWLFICSYVLWILLFPEMWFRVLEFLCNYLVVVYLTSFYKTISWSVCSPPPAQQPKSALGRLIIEVSRSHIIRRARARTHTHTHTHGTTPLNQRSARRRGRKGRIFMPCAGFVPTIPAIKRPQTYTLDRTVAGMCFCMHTW
jgi:hypothetical protein